MLYAGCVNCIYILDGNKVVWYIQGYFVISVVPNVRKPISNAPKCVATRTWAKIGLQQQSCVVFIVGFLSLIIETGSLCSRIKEKIRRVQVSFQLVNALWLDLLTLKIYALFFPDTSLLAVSLAFIFKIPDLSWDQVQPFFYLRCHSMIASGILSRSTGIANWACSSSMWAPCSLYDNYLFSANQLPGFKRLLATLKLY